MMDGTTLPTELVLGIFCALESLEDALSLGAASRRLRRVWAQHTDLIYHRLAPRSIPGEKYGRSLQLAISGSLVITSGDAAKIVHRAKFVDSIIIQFNDKIASNLRVGNMRSVYPNGIHPRYLRPAERRRFIRTYYQLWTLIRLPDQDWAPAISSLLIKQIYLLREMCWIPLPIGEDLPAPNLGTKFHSFMLYSTKDRRGRLGQVLQDAINEHVKRKNSPWCDEDPWLVREETRGEGYGGFHLIWDHGKAPLKQYCLGRPDKKGVEPEEEEVVYERRHLWVDTSDEEGDGV